MKPLPFILILSALALVSKAQQGATPPAPGSAPAPLTGAAPTLPEPAATEAGPSGAPGTVTTISGGALPPSGGIAASNAPAPPLAQPGDAAEADASGTPVALAPDTAPPGLPAADEKDSAASAKVDFLQRSNLILAKLLDSERAMDPFGLTMDPANAKEAPVLADQYDEVEETTVVNNSMLKNALLTLPITGIYPQRGLIVIGARSFKVGEQFGMKLQDLTIRLRFEGVRDGEVFFKDMETREVTSVPFNTRPAEFEPMVKGSKRSPGSGIVPMNELFIAN